MFSPSHKVFLPLLLTIQVIIFSENSNAQINPFLSETRVITEESLSAFCNSESQLDLQMCEALGMVKSYLDGDFDRMHESFNRFIGRRTESSDQILELSTVYRYARYLEITGNNSMALRYYQFLWNVESKECRQLYSVLGELGYIGIEKNEYVISQFTEEVDFKMACLSNDEKAIVVLKLIRYLNDQETVLLLRNYSNLASEILDENIKCKYLASSFYHFSLVNDELSERYFDEYEQCIETHDDGQDSLIILTQLQQNALKKGDYSEALGFAQKSVINQYGEYNNIEDLIEIYKKSNLHSFQSILNLAQAKLFQTRLGLGLTPVKEAYDLYFGVYSFDLTRTVSKVRKLSSTGIGTSVPDFQNLLIVGNYLHEKTGEERYLEESISILDGYAGAGTYFWALARERMRRDPGFRGAFSALLRQEAALRAAPENRSLAELFAQDEHLRQDRKAFRETYADFYEQLHAGYKIDLEALRSTFGGDSSAAVCFYATEVILYRFFVSKDTTELTILDRDLAEVRELTRKLKQVVGSPGQDQSAIDASSHRLYQLLFTGLDDLLPHSVHVVASDELIDIPFAGLRMDDSAAKPRYLGTAHALSRQFSLGSMLALVKQKRTPAYAQPLALAPAFSGELLAASALRQAGFTLPPLQYNEEEVRKIEALGDGRYLYGDAATVAGYRKRAADYGVLHFASHAISSQLDGVRSRVFLLDEQGEPTALYAADLEDQTLNADLVVLSACETGGGGRNAVEGRVGLTKAFLGAGARAVVASSWAVDDYATAEIMANFYAETAKGVAPHEALRRARSNYLTGNPEAALANWAAFEAYGGMIAPAWDLKGKTNWWLWGGGLAALFGIGLGVASRRRAA